MSNYEFLKTLPGYAGDARVYRHTGGGEDIMISRANTFDRGDETMIFPYSLELEKVTSWGELYAGYGESHEEALARFEEV